MVGRIARRAEHSRAHSDTGQRGVEVNRLVLPWQFRYHDVGANGAAVAAGCRDQQHTGCWHADRFLETVC